jgi:hypothetical protein
VDPVHRSCSTLTASRCGSLADGGLDDPRGELWNVDLSDGKALDVAGTTLQVLHTPRQPGRGLPVPIVG